MDRLLFREIRRGLSSVTTSPVAATYLWSISGSGTITGPTNTSTVTVTAGSSGAFTLSLVFTTSGAVGQCTLGVTLGPAVECVPCGPNSLYAYQWATYTAPEAQAYAWTITGNGAISGPTNGPSVLVQAGSTGTFTLSVQLTRSSGTTLHSKVVQVLQPAPGGADANANIAVHLQSP